ncbi:hypothetical protein [Mesorhizobium sp. ES1-1]|uniref:hypothetical protein n=1 Tax=Mesorhizobium sp. ES1-1 TaxID=2876629 RepID=UPI001CCE6A16|nr:hypothetical protein [Mesorhizobium sp. ES1-1]MBZ9674308.1 hypothetical protein [Mesorhizobium sp. ES1-1]
MVFVAWHFVSPMMTDNMPGSREFRIPWNIRDGASLANEQRNHCDGHDQEPRCGATIERKGTNVTDGDPAPSNSKTAPKTAGAAPDGERPLPDPFTARQSDARRPMAGKTPRPTDKPGE